MTSLFSAADLAGWLGETVTDARAATAEKVVWGWLKDILGLDTRPIDVPDDLFAWAVELGGIAYRNPSGAASVKLGSLDVQYSSERRDEILEDVAQSAIATAGSQPEGDFPEAWDYPDPADPSRCSW
jgi:hypothetical protein